MMARLICALGIALTIPPLNYDGRDGDTPSKLTQKEKADYLDLHKTDPPHEWPEVSPASKVRAKKAVNWPGNLGEQYGLEGNVSTRGQTHDEKVGKVVAGDATP